MGNIRSSVLAFKLNSAATNNATLIKAGTGQLYSLVVTNNNAAVRYLKVYDKATLPVPGTDVPALTIQIPIGTYVHLNFGTFGLSYSLGLGISLGTVATDTPDATTVSAREHKLNIAYA